MEKLSNVYFKDFSDLGFDGSCKKCFCFSHQKLRTNPPANLPVGGLHKLVKEVESGDLVYEMKPFKINFQLLKQARQTAFNVVSTPIEGKKKTGQNHNAKLTLPTTA